MQCGTCASFDFSRTGEGYQEKRRTGCFWERSGRELSENVLFNLAILSVVEETSAGKRSHLCVKPKRFIKAIVLPVGLQEKVRVEKDDCSADLFLLSLCLLSFDLSFFSNFLSFKLPQQFGGFCACSVFSISSGVRCHCCCGHAPVRKRQTHKQTKQQRYVDFVAAIYSTGSSSYQYDAVELDSACDTICN